MGAFANSNILTCVGHIGITIADAIFLPVLAVVVYVSLSRAPSFTSSRRDRLDRRTERETDRRTEKGDCNKHFRTSERKRKRMTIPTETGIYFFHRKDVYLLTITEAPFLRL